MNYTLQEIAEITGGELKGSCRGEITRIGTDSRTLHRQEGLLFLAIRGERHDGHRFVPELIGRGVKVFMVGELPQGEPESRSGSCFILVKDPLAALQELAAHHRGKSHAKIIGITGSNGKTIVKEWIHQVLSPDMRLVRSPKSYNSQLGVPLSVLLLEEETRMGVFEAGISRPGEMEKLQRIILPEIGILTNIGEAHREGFRDREEKIREKLRLFVSCRKIIYRDDAGEVDRMMKQEFPREKLFTWSLGTGTGMKADMNAEFLKEDPEGPRYRIRSGDREAEISVPFRDRASVENAMHVAALMLLLDYDPLLIGSRIADLNPVAMRMEMVKGINSCTLVNDSYNSDLVSLSIALDYLDRLNRHDRKTLILSDIMQSGREGADLYGEVAGMLGKMNIRRFIGIGPDLLDQRKLFPEDSRFFASTGDFLASLNALEFRDETILIKGSRMFGFEKITRRLQEKSHATVLEIDLNALVHNLNVYRSLTGARIMVMVKAFSYGSGSLEIASALQYQRVDYLCVAYVDEGIALREGGIHLPILVMNPEVSGFDLMMDYNLEPEIYNFRSLFNFISAFGKRDLDSYPVHLKLETGMNRLGFREAELDQLFDVLKDNPGLEIRSVFSHLGAADEPVHDSYTREQIRAFERMSGRILDGFQGDILRHILNTAGIERFPEAGFDMVRLGIGLYGIGTDDGPGLQAVSTLKSIISQIKPVYKGESVGYGRNFMAKKDMTIGIIPVGYADGLRRDLGRRGVSFLVGGTEVPVLGHLCMDMCMVDLSGTDAREGDEVQIFGKDKPVAELARRLGTIPYEILTGLSERVKRVYFQE